MQQIKPITPDGASQERLKQIPDEVIEIFNNHITRAWDGNKAILSRNDVIEDIMEKLQCERNDVFSHKYHDIDAIYAATGWCVDGEVPIFITFTRRDK